MTSATLARPNEIPRSGGGARAIALAVVMHLLLGALLFFGIRWQSSPPATIEAELWSATPQTAAPAPRPAAVQPAPAPKVEVVRPVPKVEEVKPEPKADIVEKAPPKPEPKKKKEPPKVEAKPEPKPAPVTPKVEAKPQPKAPPAPAVPSDLKNLLAAADGPTSTARPGTGRDQQTSGPRGDSKGYIARLVAAIRSQARYPASSPGNPVVKMRIEQLPTGEVVNVTVLNSSGVPAFDAAIERAIRAASPLPRNDQGGVERELVVDYNMYDKP